MSKIEFKTVEEATEAYTKLLAEKDALASSLKEKESELVSVKSELEVAKEVAQDAIQQINEGLSTDVIATVDKKKYKVLFGVDGLSKEELSKDQTSLKNLVKIGSGALELVEG